MRLDHTPLTFFLKRHTLQTHLAEQLRTIAGPYGACMLWVHNETRCSLNLLDQHSPITVLLLFEVVQRLELEEPPPRHAVHPGKKGCPRPQHRDKTSEKHHLAPMLEEEISA